MPTKSEVVRWTVRFLLCLATAVAVSGTAYLCAWNGYRNVYPHSGHGRTRTILERLREEVEGHKKTAGEWPARLTDLKGLKEKELHLDETGLPVDWWGRPLQYRVDAGGYVLYSHGRDGQPGGSGEAADLYAGQADPASERPTLWQFTALQEAIPAQIACLLAGVVTFVVCLIYAKGEPGKTPSLLRVLVANVVTAVFAFLAAVMMAALHYMPGGH